jgi:hypothetical protein
MDELVQAISTVGFPIVCVLILFWYVKYVTDRNTEELKELREAHAQEVSQMTQALNNNTLTIQKLIDALSVTIETEGE